MIVIPIKTRPLVPPKDDLFGVLEEYLPRLREKDVVLVTSKIVSIGEGRCVKIGSRSRKNMLIEEEADYLARFARGRRSMFSIKGNTVIGSAGIDESNGNGFWTLWPKKPFESARELWRRLRKRHRIKKLAVIITDSYCPPMRLGTTGISIAFFGFHPTERHIGKSDIFGRKFVFSRSNIVDGLAAAGVCVMGETDERTPLAIIRDFPRLRFAEYDTRRELLIRPSEDIYYPVFKPIYEAKKENTSTIHATRRRLA